MATNAAVTQRNAPVNRICPARLTRLYAATGFPAYLLLISHSHGKHEVGFPGIG
jgi:hypothetical protein